MPTLSGVDELLHALGDGHCRACRAAPARGGGRWGARLCPDCAHVVGRGPQPVGLPLAPAAGAMALGGYGGPVGALVRRAKYGGDPDLLRALGEEWARWLEPGGYTAVVPAPSTWRRRLGRGWSPGALVAGPVARRLGVPVVPALARGAGVAQAGLAHADRSANLAGLRAVRGVTGRVLLVDDVLTTGATARAAATELLGAGAGEVWALVVAARGVPGL